MNNILNSFILLSNFIVDYTIILYYLINFINFTSFVIASVGGTELTYQILFLAFLLGDKKLLIVRVLNAARKSRQRNSNRFEV